MLRKGLLLIATILLSLSITCYANSNNLLTNGGFEDWVNELPAAWSTAGQGLFSLERNEVYSGNCSFSIASIGENVEPSVRQNIILEPAQYKIVVHYRADSEQAARHTRVQLMLMRGGEHYKIKPEEEEAVIVYSAEGTKTSIYWDFLWLEPEEDAIEPGVWQKLEAIVDFSSYDPMVMMVELQLWRQAGKVWWDEVSFTKMN